jgi:hypothetical protein
LVNGKWQGFCPICNYYRKLWQDSDKVSGDDADKLIAEARSIKPLERYYYNVIVRSQVNPSTGEVEKDVGPKILSIGKQLHARIIRAILGDPVLDEPELGDVTHPESGRDFKIIKRIRKSGGDAFPNYDESKFMGVSPLGNDKQVANWLENLHDLQALRQLKTTEELLKELNIFRGLEKDPSVQFEFGGNVEVKAEIKPAAKKTVVPDDEALADDDFINELRNL